MEGTITAATANGSYETKFGTMYRQDVTVMKSDGSHVTGEVSAKSENRWQTGQAVEIKSESQTEYGMKLKLGIPDSGGYSGGGSSTTASSSTSGGGDARDKSAQVGFCLSYAKDCFCAERITEDQIPAMAKKFYQWKQQLMTEL